MEGCSQLSQEDHIIIFYTENAKNIDMDLINDHGEADLSTYRIPVGKQSVDMHILSYLGFLAGKYISSKCSIVIISKDKDYDNVIKFWKKQSGLDISRKEQIIEKPQKKVEKQEKKQLEERKKSTAKTSGNPKSDLNIEVKQAVRSAGFNASVANTVASIATGLYGNSKIVSETNKAIKDNYPNYKEISEAVKPVLSKYANKKNTNNKATLSSEERNAINVEIMKKLSTAGYSSKIVTDVAKRVAKNLGCKNAKNATCKMIVAKYGQENGVKIYKLIRSLIK